MGEWPPVRSWLKICVSRLWHLGVNSERRRKCNNTTQDTSEPNEPSADPLVSWIVRCRGVLCVWPGTRAVLVQRRKFNNNKNQTTTTGVLLYTCQFSDELLFILGASKVIHVTENIRVDILFRGNHVGLKVENIMSMFVDNQ